MKYQKYQKPKNPVGFLDILIFLSEFIMVEMAAVLNIHKLGGFIKLFETWNRFLLFAPKNQYKRMSDSKNFVEARAIFNNTLSSGNLHKLS